MSAIRTIAVAALLAGAGVTARAQGPLGYIEEIRLDVATYSVIAGNSFLNIGNTDPFMPIGPGQVQLGIFLRDNLSIDPSIGFQRFKPDGGDAQNAWTLGMRMSYYLKRNRGHRGFFVAPGAWANKVGDNALQFNYGVELGYKQEVSDVISLSYAGGVRAGDSYDPDRELAFRLSISYFVR